MTMYNRDGLKELAEELDRQKKTKRDFVVDTRTLTAKNINGVLNIEVLDLANQGTSQFALTDFAHEQLADKTQIPNSYYNRLRGLGKTDLLVHNVNEFLPDKERRMIRTLDGKIRAVVSDKYRCLDNYDVMFLALDKFKEHNVELLRADLTEKYMYVKGIIGDKTEVVTEFDTLQRGIVISNSEVGAGAFRVEPFLWRLSCLNGMIGEMSIRKFHLGERLAVGEIFSNDIKVKEDELLWAKVREVVDKTFDDEFFTQWVAQIRAAEQTEVTSPTKAVDYIVGEYRLPEGAKENLLDFFSLDKTAGANVWGLANAMTRYAKSQGNYEAQIDLERLGGKLLNDKKLLAVATA